MAIEVCNGARLMCSMGSSPSQLVVLPIRRVFTEKQPAGTIADHIPLVNIQPFGMCRSLANPVVAAATSANEGKLTPSGCIPATPSPWVVGAPTVLIGAQPALDNPSKCLCNWAGIITVVMPGELTVEVP